MFTHIHFQAIAVTELPRALDFYRDKLCFVVERDNPYVDSRWIFMALPGAQTTLHCDRRDKVETSPVPLLVLVTKDVDETCGSLKGQGCRNKTRIERSAVESRRALGDD